jgi:hypothetical protein
MAGIAGELMGHFETVVAVTGHQHKKNVWQERQSTKPTNK